MSLHVFANVITPFGTAANNRGENEGNTTTLQKIVWKGMPHTSVSAEAIRYAIRKCLQESGEELNRFWKDEEGILDWRNVDDPFDDFRSGKKSYIDDDLLGFMAADAADEEAGETKGSAKVRRASMELTRAISITPWAGEHVFNAASPNATPKAAKGDSKNPVPYSAEVHATRYQFGLAMTPERLKSAARAIAGLNAVCNLSNVGGNHARFKYDFSPEAVVIRVTQDPAPRMLYCFDAVKEGADVGSVSLVNRITLGDIEADELFVGCANPDSLFVKQMKDAGLREARITGVKKAFKAACDAIESQLPESSKK